MHHKKKNKIKWPLNVSHLVLCSAHVLVVRSFRPQDHNRCFSVILTCFSVHYKQLHACPYIYTLQNKYCLTFNCRWAPYRKAVWKKMIPVFGLEVVVLGGRMLRCTVVFMVTDCVQIQVQTLSEKLQSTIDWQRTVATNVANLIFPGQFEFKWSSLLCSVSLLSYVYLNNQI